MCWGVWVADGDAVADVDAQVWDVCVLWVAGWLCGGLESRVRICFLFKEDEGVKALVLLLFYARRHVE